MPVRHRAGSSPIRGSLSKEGVELNVISPSRRSHEGRLRSGSLTGVEAVKQRARRDTATSSEFSSENEVDPAHLKRRQINPAKAAKFGDPLTQKQQEDERRQQTRTITATIHEGSDKDDQSDASSDFGGSAGSESLLDGITAGSLDMPPQLNFGRSDSPSPKKPKAVTPPSLQPLPPPRPISTMMPASLLGQALRALKVQPTDPVERFARLSGKGVPDPLYIKIYATFSETHKPIEMPLVKSVQDPDSGETPPTTVADAIGLALWRYREEAIKPAIENSKLNVNRWTLRMIEDGEVDFDFPALARNRSIADFTSNNNRGARGRSREKPFDEFALVEATEAQYNENKKLTPKYEKFFMASVTIPPNETAATRSETKPQTSTLAAERRPPPTRTYRPNLRTIQSTPRIGALKELKIYFTSLEARSQTAIIEVPADTYIAEILELVCKNWSLDKTYHILKIRGTPTVAPVDRTVEALGARLDLDLTRRRFANDGAIGFSGSPGSSSPNAPLILGPDGPTRSGGKRQQQPLYHPLSQAGNNDVNSHSLINASNFSRYKHYVVTRKGTISFTSSQQRVLLLDEEFLHILPSDIISRAALVEPAANSKATRRIPFSMIVGCKVNRRHPRSLRVVVARQGGQEEKRYDFEAASVEEAGEIVEVVRKVMEVYVGRLVA